MAALRSTRFRQPFIAPRRGISRAFFVVLTALLVLPAGALAARTPPRKLAHASLSQAGKELIFTVRTSSPLAVARLQAHPDVKRPASRYLCLALRRAGGKGELRLCVGGRHAKRQVGSERLDARGRVIEKGGVRATVKRPNPRKLVVALVPGDARLAPHGYGWRVIESAGCAPARQPCAESLPGKGGFSFRLRPVRAVGCTGGSAGLVTSGPRDRKIVALSFDDGPSDYTDDFLAVLREKGVHATFFEIGEAMSGHGATMRRILAEGHELGDHTMGHVELPGHSQIAGAAERIEDYTHFEPCLFRPPGGAVNSSVIADAGGLGMRTITWDVDPRDWTNPGTSAIYNTVVDNTRPGSVVLMHDGGGPRGETLAALPAIIDTLRGRGYRFATVSELLGHRLIYKPYG
jgi:peptidoglycan-N-acetylglucosamine deacetylase